MRGKRNEKRRSKKFRIQGEKGGQKNKEKPSKIDVENRLKKQEKIEEKNRARARRKSSKKGIRNQD